MLLNIILVLMGLVSVLWGADGFTEGAGGLARKFHVSELVIGLTIVALGTSAPELAVSLMAQIQGSSAMAVGNVLGSNIFNILAIMGVTAMVAPIAISREMVMRDMPWCVFASLLLSLFIFFDGTILQSESFIFLVSFGIYLFVTLRQSRQQSKEVKGIATDVKLWKCMLKVAVGLAALVIGSRVFVKGATDIAHVLNISDAVVGLTIAAWGTSLPELATSVSAARKGQTGLAIGNVVGSNLFNILFILGVAGSIRPLDARGFTLLDLVAFLVSVPLLWFFTRTKYEICRWEGACLFLLFVVYSSLLILYA